MRFRALAVNLLALVGLFVSVIPGFGATAQPVGLQGQSRALRRISRACHRQDAADGKS